MSMLSVVEQAIKSCKAEQVKIQDSIQLYREILQALTPQPQTDFDDLEHADAAISDTNTSPAEKEDLELLERALEKALWVRTGSGVSKKDPNRNKQHGPRKEPDTSDVTSKSGTQSSAPSKGSRTTIRSTSKSASLDRKEHKKPELSTSSTFGSRPSASTNPGQSKTTNYRNIIQNHPVSSAGVLHHHTAGKFQQAGSVSGSLDHISTFKSKNKTVKSSRLSGDDLGRATAVSTPSANNSVPFPHKDESGTLCSLQHNEMSTEQAAKWKYLRNKQNRLWNKFVAFQRKPALGRNHFIQTMKAKFPKDPVQASPDQTRALVNTVTHQGHVFIHHLQRKQLLVKLSSTKQTDVATDLAGKKNKYDSHLMEEELHNFADQVKQEWEAWDQWRPDGGCLCPTRANSVWEDGMIAPLTITYTTEEELRELEKLRMRVALLQQEINIEQALLDTLSPHLSSIPHEPGCPNSSVLRDVYSLLGEGGERFPATVLDSEPD